MARREPHWDSRTPAPYGPRAASAAGEPVTEADARRLLRYADVDADVVTFVRRQASTSHVREDAAESERVARKAGVKRVTTRTVRHVTTVTRSEQRAAPPRAEFESQQQQQQYQQHQQRYYDAAWSTERRSGPPAVAYYREQAAPRPPERSHHHRRKVNGDGRA